MAEIHNFVILRVCNLNVSQNICQAIQIFSCKFLVLGSLPRNSITLVSLFKTNLDQDNKLTFVSFERGQRLIGTGMRHDSCPSIKMHLDEVYCSSSS